MEQMYPIYLFNNKEKGFIGIDVEQFEKEFYNICEDHRKNNKARAFAFILSDFHTMQATQIIMDNELWNNLHTKSGEFLTIFHLNYKSEELNALFREGETDFVRQRFDSFFKKLTNIFEDTEFNKINMPAILFFQTHAAEIIDYFIIELNQKGLNKDISELDFYIESAVESAKGIDSNNLDNSQEIFRELKKNIDSKRFKKKWGKRIKKAIQIYQLIK